MQLYDCACVPSDQIAASDCFSKAGWLSTFPPVLPKPAVPLDTQEEGAICQFQGVRLISVSFA